uniref:MADF domain-containing protein n=1 Tax=Anopheles culicifacies TaxID=139723 RepID=A0A182MIB3_9DIPT
MQRIILEKLQLIESSLANHTNHIDQEQDQEQARSNNENDQEQSVESVHSLADANEFVQLPEYAFQMRDISHQEQHQHTGEYPEEVQLYSFSRMQTEDELNDFEKRLSDPEYFKEAYNWLNSLITETNCENRMLAALDLLFDKVFVNKCSWTGRGRSNTRKAPIRCRRNLLQLFKVIGSTRKAIVSRADVEIFFIKKLKQSKQRLNMQGTVAMSQKQMLHFIRLVEERDVLWNRSHPDYKDMEKQGYAWTEISNIINIPEAKLVDKWKSLYGSYRCYLSKVLQSISTDSCKLPRKCKLQFYSITNLLFQQLDQFPNLHGLPTMP